ncbi:hypothetical protein CC1G_15571 [Coprinopsis cinerea okayama7|uniref:Uncharacterized protein n=1 Tax=Coprinopsis cinerea (strain Okayama-7 / 130 / ATCC MYA-4618 / FGSC 9003) TaxID=240176 RepID=D6RNB2_COPC7|nr:hypothetical protein CC1G_15571 [Coprinopsis cinerea okayama7\|eukprot:XP_002911028.1 hypothetical protein CC1G_15571 [Coprinopsis cinerea okayama7\
MDPPRIARHGCHGAPAWGPRPLPFSSPLRPQAQWQQVDFHDDSHIEDIEDDKAFFSSPARPVPMFEPGFPRHNPANANASRRQSRGINRHRFEPRNPVAPTRSTYQPHNHRMSDGLAIQGGPPMFPKQEIDPPYLDTRFENGPCVMQRPTVQIARTEVEKRIPKSEENGSFHSANPKPTRPVPAKRDPSTSPPHRLNQAEQKKSRAPNAALNARPLVLTTAPPPQKKRARQPARDAYGFGKPDQDEEWSTLPSSKKARLSRVADTRADFRTTGFFQIPGLIPLLPSVDVVKSGKSADSSQRVITFLPPPQKKKGAPAGPAKVDVKPRNSYPSPHPERGDAESRSMPSSPSPKDLAPTTEEPVLRRDANGYLASPPTSDLPDGEVHEASDYDQTHEDNKMNAHVEPSAMASRYMRARNTLKWVGF